MVWIRDCVHSLHLPAWHRGSARRFSLSSQSAAITNAFVSARFGGSGQYREHRERTLRIWISWAQFHTRGRSESCVPILARTPVCVWTGVPIIRRGKAFLISATEAAYKVPGRVLGDTEQIGTYLNARLEQLVVAIQTQSGDRADHQLFQADHGPGSMLYWSDPGSHDH